LLLAPAIAPPPLFPRCRYDFFNFHTYSQRILWAAESGSLFWCSFTHPFILSDLYLFTISSSAIYTFFRSHPQRFIYFYDFILSDLYVFPISSSDSTPGHRLQGYAASRWSLLSHLLGCPRLSCDHFARWSLKCSKTTLWVLPGTTLRAGVGNP
jgi:hypothetical protein